MALKIIWQTLIGLFLLFLATPAVKTFYFNAGLRWQYILAFSIVVAYFVTPFCRLIALKLNILDKPDWRKIHDRPTPLLGGLAVYLAFSAAILLNDVYYPGMKVLLFGASLIFVMGLIDDIKPLPAILKFVFQILITLMVILSGDIQLTFFYHASWAPLVNIPVTLLWIVGLTNAMNFFDGIDGLAASLSAISALFLGIIAFLTNQTSLGWFAVALVGACIGFMPHNLRFGKSASLFLGDAGSTFLGFTLAGLAVLGKWSNTSHFVSLSAPLLIFGILIFDMIYVNLSRIKNRQASNLFQLLTCANKDHLHHRLIFMGFARKEVVFIISTISVCLGVSALIIMKQDIIEALLGLFQAVLIIGLVVTLMLKGRERPSTEDGGQRTEDRGQTTEDRGKS
ncbi:MAG: undecaprenyl/decaprenyl-phosphate alpha-N-acetylglucosaminyl 1-phosphate transferase [Deltaproteobacteria bacterium]|nr:undecaprenyl/decaprenyl-phosphate alpha-N-acetylglucosaminyl 1-phosphate transferase [Deltaproteobacteria bacterium]